MFRLSFFFNKVPMITGLKSNFPDVQLKSFINRSILKIISNNKEDTLQTFTCSKWTTEKLEKKCEMTSMSMNNVNDVVLLRLLLTLNIINSFFYCFYCWLWTGKCLLSIFKTNSK